MQDNVMPEGKWEFNQEVTDCFDEMLERSIPGYHDMRELVTRLGCKYLQPGSTLVDIGCSNGNAIAPFIRKFGGDYKYLCLEVSEPMIAECKKRFGYIDVRKHDITKGLPPCDASVILSILTLQFTPIEYRQKIVKSIYDNLRPGGALILVEKVLGNSEEIDSVLVKEYYQIKAENSYTEEQIAAKRKSLEGVLVPITAKWNESMLHDAGFQKLDCFWRYLNFAGWVAIK